jgi:hypothetical protein
MKQWPRNMSRLVSIDKLSAEQCAQLVVASQKARPSEEYRIQFAALAQRRLELQQAKSSKNSVSKNRKNAGLYRIVER